MSRRIGASRPADPNLCFVRLGNDELSPPPQTTPGKWYWQVSRICSGCTPQPPFEVSELRSFTLAPATKPALNLPARVYAGFPFIAALHGTLPTSGKVTVERKTGSGWKSVGSGTISTGVSNVTTVLPKGRQTSASRVARSSRSPRGSRCCARHPAWSARSRRRSRPRRCG